MITVAPEGMLAIETAPRGFVVVGITRTSCTGVGVGVEVMVITSRTELSAEAPWIKIARTMMRITQRVRACIQAHTIVLNVLSVFIKFVKYDVIMKKLIFSGIDGRILAYV